MKLKIRIKKGAIEKGSTFRKVYKVSRVGQYGLWFKNDLNETEYVEFKDCEQLVGRKWEKIDANV